MKSKHEKELHHFIPYPPDHGYKFKIRYLLVRPYGHHRLRSHDRSQPQFRETDASPALIKDTNIDT